MGKDAVSILADIHPHCALSKLIRCLIRHEPVDSPFLSAHLIATLVSLQETMEAGRSVAWEHGPNPDSGSYATHPPVLTAPMAQNLSISAATMLEYVTRNNFGHPLCYYMQSPITPSNIPVERRYLAPALTEALVAALVICSKIRSTRLVEKVPIL